MDNSEAEDESVKDLNDITSELIDKKMTSMKRNVFFVSIQILKNFSYLFPSLFLHFFFFRWNLRNPKELF